jgi:hypothetical protein
VRVSPLFQFPSLGSVKGEEVPVFKNAAGEEAEIRIGVSRAETKECLTHVLHGNVHLADVLAGMVHA